MDPIRVTLSNTGLESIKSLLEDPKLTEEIKNIVTSIDGSRSLDLPELIKVIHWRCQRYKKPTDKGTATAYSIVKNSEMKFPSPPKREENPELKERLKKLAAQQANKDYNKMVENVAQKEPRRTQKSSKAPIISGLNFALTLFASCGATIYMLQSFVPDLAVRAGIGIAVGTIILVIEMYLAVREIEKQEKMK